MKKLVMAAIILSCVNMNTAFAQSDVDVSDTDPAGGYSCGEIYGIDLCSTQSFPERPSAFPVRPSAFPVRPSAFPDRP